MGQNREQPIEKGIDGLITLTMHIESVQNAAAWLTRLLQREKMFMCIQTIKVTNRLNALIVFDYGSKERNNNRWSAV